MDDSRERSSTILPLAFSHRATGNVAGPRASPNLMGMDPSRHYHPDGRLSRTAVGGTSGHPSGATLGATSGLSRSVSLGHAAYRQQPHHHNHHPQDPLLAVHSDAQQRPTSYYPPASSSSPYHHPHHHQTHRPAPPPSDPYQNVREALAQPPAGHASSSIASSSAAVRHALLPVLNTSLAHHMSPSSAGAYPGTLSAHAYGSLASSNSPALAGSSEITPRSGTRNAGYFSSAFPPLDPQPSSAAALYSSQNQQAQLTLTPGVQAMSIDSQGRSGSVGAGGMFDLARSPSSSSRQAVLSSPNRQAAPSYDLPLHYPYSPAAAAAVAAASQHGTAPAGASASLSRPPSAYHGAPSSSTIDPSSPASSQLAQLQLRASLGPQSPPSPRRTAADGQGGSRLAHTLGVSAVDILGGDIGGGGSSGGGGLRSDSGRQAEGRPEGFRRVRDASDLRPKMDQTGTGRRADPAGGYVSTLKALTCYLHHTYHLVNPSFRYELSFNPRRVLTKPSKGVHNDGYDNEDSDYILYVNDWLGTEEGNKYLILDVLGQGTFGQVVKCQNMKTHEIVAVKVIKNKPAYFNQSMMEVTILELLNNQWDPKDEHHILRLRDTFIHCKHLCLVFELLSSNLYELIKQNSFRGLSTSLVRVFTAQLLDALTVLNEARLIHCDLKPENVLLKTLQTPSIKLVDFGSACHERQTVYTYIQSRFYRSPEVLLGLPYSSSIDMWSLGCIAVELFLGLPLFPGTSEYNQISRITEMLGLPPTYMLEMGKQSNEFFYSYTDEYGRKAYKLKSLDQYSKEHNTQEQPSKRYFQATTLPEIIKTYPVSKRAGKQMDMQKEMANRTAFIDFVSGLLNLNPIERWSPQQAKLHPFITGEKFTKPFVPPMMKSTGSEPASKLAGSAKSDASKHPYGGLPGRSSNKSYQDAAAYNQHLQQQQAYNSASAAAAAAAAAQKANPANANPYARDDYDTSNHSRPGQSHIQAAQAAQAQAQAAHAQAKAAAAAAKVQPQSQAHLQTRLHTGGSYNNAPMTQGSGQYFHQTRNRSNTINQMDLIPPQIAKAALGVDVSAFGTKNVLTPAINREESLREWERRQNGLSSAASSTASGGGGGAGKRTSGQYQQLDFLQEQAEASWNGSSGGRGGASALSTFPQQQTILPYSTGTGTGTGASAGEGSAYQRSSAMPMTQAQAAPFSIVVDGHDRRTGHANRDASGAGLGRASASRGGGDVYDFGTSASSSSAGVSSSIAAPPAAYATNSRHQPSYALSPTLPFDMYDSNMRDTGIAQLTLPLQPSQYKPQTSQRPAAAGMGGSNNWDGTLGGGAGHYPPPSSATHGGENPYAVSTPASAAQFASSLLPTSVVNGQGPPPQQAYQSSQQNPFITSVDLTHHPTSLLNRRQSQHQSYGAGAGQHGIERRSSRGDLRDF